MNNWLYKYDKIYTGVCKICGTTGYKLTRHHLHPLSLEKHLSGQHNIIKICAYCHDFLHVQFTSRQLLEELGTLDKIKDNEFVQEFVNSRKESY